MEELERLHHPFMGFYFSCPRCQQKYVSAECVEEHSSNCHMQSSSVMIPKIKSYSSMNPQSIELNLDTKGFPIHLEIIKKEPEDYVEDDNEDWQDEDEYSTLSSRAGTPQAHDTLNRRKLQSRLARQNAKIPLHSDETEDSNSSQDVPKEQQARPFSKMLRSSLRNPRSTCTKDRYMCRYCPRTFAYPSAVYPHEGIHKPKYSCPTCGERFRRPASLTHHMKSHEPDSGFRCCYPGCLQTFKSTFTRWKHHKTHPRAWLRERVRWSKTVMKMEKSHKNTSTIVPKSEHLLADNESTRKQMTDSIRKPSVTTFKSSKTAWATASKNRKMMSHDPAIIVLCCYPDCSKTFNSKFKRWIHHKTHPNGNWNKSERRPSWTVQQNQETSTMPPKLSPQTQNFDDNESTETSSMPDLTIEEPMPHSETKFPANLELDNVQESAVNGSTIKQEPKETNTPPKTRKRGRPARPGNEIEIMTAWGIKFKCDLCDKMFATRNVAKYHRLKHFDTPQVSCYITGCSQMFFSKVQRINHLKSVHNVKFRKGRPFIGSSRVAFNITGHRKVITKEIKPSVSADRKPSQSPPKIPLNESSNPDQNIPRGSQTGGLSSEVTLLFTCGICDDSFENYDALKCHMLATHAGQEESQAKEIGTPADNKSIGNLSIPDLSIEGPMAHSETTFTNSLELDNVQQSASNDSTKNQEPRGSNVPPKTHRRGGKARPGYEIEIMTAALGRKFKCDLCDKMFTLRYDAKEHRLSHFDEPQLPCYIKGCPQMFFSRFQRVHHLKKVHHVQFRKGKPFIGARPVALEKFGLRKIIAKAVIPNVATALKRPQPPPNIQIRKFAEICSPTDNESMENLSLLDHNYERPMSHWETKSTNNPALESVQHSASNDATINQEPRGSNIPPKTHRRGRPSQPGDEIEIMTAWGRKFKCDLCDKMFLTRMIARDHRLGHFDEPQLPCYIKGCSQIFFSRVGRVNHLKSVHNVQFRKGKPFIGSRCVALKRTRLGKAAAAKEIIPHVRAIRRLSQSPPKIQINKSPAPDQNIPRGSERRGLGPGEALQFTCGICGNRYEKLDALKCHMLKTHAGPKELQAEESAGISTPVDNCFGSVQSTSKAVQIPAEVKENEATSSPPENFIAQIQQQGPAPRYPILQVGDNKYFYCGFPGCDQVFSNRTSRYAHHKKIHNDAHRSLLTSLADQPEKKANETSSTQMKEHSDEVEEKPDMDSPTDFPFVEVNGKKYFWCSFPDCGVVVTNLEARRLHHKKHQIGSKQKTIAQSSVRPDPKKRKVSPNAPMQLHFKRPKIAEGDEDKILGQTLPTNQQQMSEVAIKSELQWSAQSPTQVQAAILDQDLKGDEQEVCDLQNQSMDTLNFIATDDDDNPMEHVSFFSEDFNTENIVQADSGLGSELSSEASASNPALRNILNPTSTKTDKVVQRPTVLKKQKSRGRPQLYSRIQIGTRKLLCCDVPGCGGVFNSRNTLYLHLKGHRVGKKVRPKLKLMEDGTVFDSTEGSFVIE